MVFKVMNINLNCAGFISKETGDRDSILAVRYRFSNWVTFSDTLFQEQQNQPVYITYDPPGDFVRPEPGPSQHVTFDGVPLSKRDEAYQEAAVNFFAENILALYLRPVSYFVQADADVSTALDGRFPKSVEDIAQLVCANPALLNKVERVSGEFDSNTLAQATRMLIRHIIENYESAIEFVNAPEEFIKRLELSEIPDREYNALLRAAAEKQDQIVHTVNDIELGASSKIGDGNTYILIGFDRETMQPDKEGLKWYIDNIRSFVNQNGSFPAFGYYITEALLRYNVIVGPGVSQREVDYLIFQGHVVSDYRDVSRQPNENTGAE